jgi:hypothetical protein
VAAGLVVTLVVALLAGLFASGSPDGLERVAADQGLTSEQQPHQLDDSPLAGYQATGVDGALSGGIAALAGIGVTFVLAAGAVRLLRRRGPDTAAPDTATFRPGVRPGDQPAGRSAGEDA